MAIVVNSFWLDRLWDPVSSETYEDDPSLSALDTADETAVRWLARTYLAPGVARLDPTQHQCLKETLRYGLNAFSDRQLTSTLERCLPPFRVHRHVRVTVPPNIRWFYEVIWQELFGPEDWHVQDLTTYVVDQRLSSPLPSEAIIVNPSWLDRLWSPIGGGADVDDHPLEDLNAADETAVRRLAREYLATGFARYTPTQQRCLKETFRYGLNALSDHSLERAFDACLPPFEATSNIRWFYEIIWQELFGPEDWHLPSLDHYTIDHDRRTPFPSAQDEEHTASCDTSSDELRKASS